MLAASRPSLAAPVVAVSARLAGDSERMRLVIDTDRKPEFAVRYLDGPPRAVIELPATSFAFPDDMLEPRGLVTAIRYGSAGAERARIVVDLKFPARLIPVDQSNPADSGLIERLAFDLVRIDAAAFADLARQSASEGLENAKSARPSASNNRELVVVIDAGHGGIDGGAEGRGGTIEKDVTLAFAQALSEALSGLDRVRTVMTRTDDTFLSLGARVRVARAEKADLFLSLHADSIAIRSLRGATIYTLSDRASDALAQSLADQDSNEDGISGLGLAGAPEDVAHMLIDLARSSARVLSTGLAGRVIESFEGQVRLINNPHRQAGFRVLQAPDVPSVLIELGYLSNREDEELLADPQWRKETARLLAGSIERYRTQILTGGK